jgi:hypothetical protein
MGLLDGTADPDKLLDTCKELALKEGPRVGWGVWGIIKVSPLYTSAVRHGHELEPGLMGRINCIIR